jgi:hypothetical protein
MRRPPAQTTLQAAQSIQECPIEQEPHSQTLEFSDAMGIDRRPWTRGRTPPRSDRDPFDDAASALTSPVIDAGRCGRRLYEAGHDPITASAQGRRRSSPRDVATCRGTPAGRGSANASPARRRGIRRGAVRRRPGSPNAEPATATTSGSRPPSGWRKAPSIGARGLPPGAVLNPTEPRGAPTPRHPSRAASKTALASKSPFGSSSRPAPPEQDDDAQRLRGVVALPHERATLFMDQVELDAEKLP